MQGRDDDEEKSGQHGRRGKGQVSLPQKVERLFGIVDDGGDLYLDTLRRMLSKSDKK